MKEDMAPSTNNSNDPNNDWIQLGQAELRLGKESIAHRNFKKALEHFERAKDTFQQASRADENCRDAKDEVLEATELASLVLYVIRAQVELDDGEREESLNTLKLAKAYLCELEEDGHEHFPVATVIALMQEEAASELESILDTEAELNRAEKHLEERDLQAAEEGFKRALHASLPELKKHAEEGLEHVKREKTLFKKEMQQGRENTHPLEAAKHYSEARRIWCGRPEALDALEKSLLAAVEEAKKEGKKQQVALLCQQILEKVNPENQQAIAILARMDLEPQVKALLKRTRVQLSLSETELDDLKALQFELEEMHRKSEGYQELYTKLAGALQNIQQRANERGQAEAAVQEAEKLLRQGDWEKGVKAYEGAVGVMGEHVPHAYLERRGKLRKAWKVIQQTQKEVPAAMEKANVGYLLCLQKNNFEAIKKTLSSVNVLLGRVKQVLDPIEGVIAPLLLDELGTRANDLHKRVELVHEVRGAPDPRKELSKVRVQAGMLGRDEVLDALERELMGRLKEELPRLLRQADGEIRDGRLINARNTLRLAREIELDNSEIDEMLARLEEHEKLWEEILRVRANVDSKQNSPFEAMKAVRAGLEVLRFARTELVEDELREKLDELLDLENKDDGFSLSNSDVFAQAQNLVANFTKDRSISTWVERDAKYLAERWLGLAYMIASQRVIESAIAIGDLLWVYRATRQMWKSAFPHDQVGDQELKAREALINRQAISAQKRYVWAQEAFERDDFDDALANLDGIESDFFASVEKEFPKLFEGVEVIDEIRRRAQELRVRIERGKAAYATAQFILEEARSLFQEDNLKKANTKLDELEQVVNLESGSNLIKNAQDLRRMVTQARQDKAVKDMESKLIDVESAFRVAFHCDDFVLLGQKLSALKEQEDFIHLRSSPDVMDKYHRIYARVDNTIASIKRSVKYKSEAESAFEKKDYKSAASRFRKALDETLAPDEKIELEIMMEKSEELFLKEQRNQSILESSYANLTSGEYAIARTEFLKVIGWASDAELAFHIARAGVLCSEAEKLINQNALPDAQDILMNVQKILLDAERQLTLCDDSFAKILLAVIKELDQKRQKMTEKFPPKDLTKSILIVTVTKVEAQAVMEAFSQPLEKQWIRQNIGSNTYYNLGVHGGVQVFMAQSEMGTATPGGTLLTVSNAISDLHPQAVISCGIAYGLRPDKQKLGDILVSRQLEDYEPQKLDLKRGRMQRGDRATASERLLRQFRNGDNNWEGSQTHIGLILSGEKLVNSPGFRNRLLKTEPEAIGGEMEGAGLYVAARSAKVDWILVKAICDWADGTKNDEAQPLAARNAAQFVLHVLQLGGWGEPAQSLPKPKKKKPVEKVPLKRKAPLKIFISYSHKDEKFKDELVTALAGLQKRRLIVIWHDGKIGGGTEWRAEIKRAMEECGLALLLVSKYFLASNFIQDKELPRLFKRRKNGGLWVMPIILRSCHWQAEPILKDILALPKDGKPIVGFKGDERDKKWEEIVSAINERVK